ncbi:MAG: TM2 domain-containing protein [Acutalibacteraceae bacterium]|nr:TM2 domain-containing protein [Acutalibacteraceae bacterium]
MVCKNCGATVGMEYRLCPYCGQEIEYPTQQNQQTPPPQQQPIIIQNVVSNTNNNTNTMNVGARGYRVTSKKSKSVAMILAIVSLFGIGGLHRFYVGKTASGVVHLFTMGLFWVGTIADLLSISKGTFTDSNGLPITK